MQRKKRRRKVLVPTFEDGQKLEVGKPVNPYWQWPSHQVRAAVRAFRKLSSGQKVTCDMLASRCYAAGYCYDSELNLAVDCGISERTIRRHLRALEKVHLIKVANDPGDINFYWFLHHPIFAFLSPRTPDGTVRGSGHQWPGVQTPVSAVLKEVNELNTQEAALARRVAPTSGGRLPGIDAKTGTPVTRGEVEAQGPITDRKSTSARPSHPSSNWQRSNNIDAWNYDRLGFSDLCHLARDYRAALNDPVPARQAIARRELPKILARLKLFPGAPEIPNQEDR